MARKGENICKRKDGRWEARYIVGRKENGKAIYKSIYAHSYREVKEKRNIKLRELKDSSFLCQPKAGTLETVAKDWIESNEHNWKKSTKCRYLEKLNTYIIPEFGDRDLSDISTKEIEDFIVKLQTDGYFNRKPIGSSTASMVLTIFRQIGLQAKKSDCQVRYSAECISIKKNKTKIEVLSESEEKKLISKLRENINETNIGILTCLFTGIRIGEICALRCDNIDLNNSVIHIRETMQVL